MNNTYQTTWANKGGTSIGMAGVWESWIEESDTCLDHQICGQLLQTPSRAECPSPSRFLINRISWIWKPNFVFIKYRKGCAWRPIQTDLSASISKVDKPTWIWERWGKMMSTCLRQGGKTRTKEGENKKILFIHIITETRRKTSWF